MNSKHPAAVALGTLGGLARSERKASASRENGKKGGRPRHLQNFCPYCRRLLSKQETAQQAICNDCRRTAP